MVETACMGVWWGGSGRSRGSVERDWTMQGECEKRVGDGAGGGRWRYVEEGEQGTISSY